jgi:hypothetical protein
MRPDNYQVPASLDGTLIQSVDPSSYSYTLDQPSERGQKRGRIGVTDRHEVAGVRLRIRRLRGLAQPPEASPPTADIGPVRLSALKYLWHGDFSARLRVPNAPERPRAGSLSVAADRAHRHSDDKTATGRADQRVKPPLTAASMTALPCASPTGALGCWSGTNAFSTAGKGSHDAAAARPWDLTGGVATGAASRATGPRSTASR